MSDYRIEKDSMGEVRVPADALYKAQTQRAVDNFPIDAPRFARVFIRALGLIKVSAAETLASLGLLEPQLAAAIAAAAREVADGLYDEHFPLVICQTGSGTSTNMNANEVIASLANRALKKDLVHPNDHVNMGQSSNDVIPTAIHVSAALATRETLLPALSLLADTLEGRARELSHVVKTGRTHLMDAMPLSVGQELGAWAAQCRQSIRRIEGALPAIEQLAIGGTAVGTGVNAPAGFAAGVVTHLAKLTDIPFREAADHFSAQGSQDAAVELSGALKTTASALMKIANDLRFLSSGPIAGLGEITLPGLQPGSSIMPGKVNPVICEALMMSCAQVIGNDTTIALSNTHGNFQLNVMLPVIAHNLLQSITMLGTAVSTFAHRAVAGFTVNEKHIAELIERNPILVTTLNPVIGYDLAARIAKRAYAEGRRVRDVAAEMTELDDAQLDKLLDPKNMI